MVWEAYTKDSLTVALEKVNVVIDNNLTTDFLRAKAYILRGALQYRLGNVMAAKSDFNQAKLFDPDGPIARLAEENLLIIAVNGLDEKMNIPNNFVLEQSYPNPFNPVTTIQFDVQKNLKLLSLFLIC